MELNDGKIKVIAYYLPQFHPFKENDEWWGPGFTEWTNVGKAIPLFKGHYQPKVPLDLGYYDLRVQNVAIQQAELAKEAGVTGFCYWHYWFGNGRKLLEMPAERMLQSGQPDFPFCFAWANHSWWRKSWSPNGSSELLIEQQYPGLKDIDDHFYYCLPFFKDERYMRYNGKPLFLIYKHLDYANINQFIKRWNELARKEGLSDGFYFLTGLIAFDLFSDAIKHGLDGGIIDVNARLGGAPSFFKRAIGFIKRKIGFANFGLPHRIDYLNLIDTAWSNKDLDRNDIIPQIMPNWDHTPRSGKFGNVYLNATPKNFGRMLAKILPMVNKKDNKLLVLKSWNEWGEGNYMEPDIKYGHGFIEALANQLKKYQ
ncbi:MAG: glycoside hydrolase family 99-like domain-containing protein [Muribaculaceae bacterium]|nr:glycoside hydrolase family 99-like domain-containing protein [Muribaculaceae bacterium]